MNEGMKRALRRLEIPYDVFFYPLQLRDWEKNDDFQEKLDQRLAGGEYDAVLSVNFTPLISDVCGQRDVLYYSWIYDSPVHIRDLDTMRQPCNRIYDFDRGQVLEYRRQGIDVRHMPLAVDTDVFEKAIAASDAQKYSGDISFVGSLYQTEYPNFRALLSEYLRGYLDGIINAQMKVYGGYLIPELITDDLLARVNEEYAKAATDGYRMRKRVLETMLATEATGRERCLSLSLLSSHFSVNLYSGSKGERLNKVRACGYADYDSEMPAIFANSKINLNISLKCIRTGIPLRAIDILGCGGFLLSNYQEEMAEFLAPGEDCVLYESTEDLYEKAAYYLSHEEERKRIAAAGLERAKRDFTFDDRLRRMLILH